jgi:hypothetical protein
VLTPAGAEAARETHQAIINQIGARIVAFEGLHDPRYFETAEYSSATLYLRTVLRIRRGHASQSASRQHHRVGADLDGFDNTANGLGLDTVNQFRKRNPTSRELTISEAFARVGLRPGACRFDATRGR